MTQGREGNGGGGSEESREREEAGLWMDGECGKNLASVLTEKAIAAAVEGH